MLDNKTYAEQILWEKSVQLQPAEQTAKLNRVLGDEAWCIRVDS